MSRPKVVVLNSASVDGRIAVSPGKLLLYGDERWQAIESWGPIAPEESVFARKYLSASRKWSSAMAIQALFFIKEDLIFNFERSNPRKSQARNNIKRIRPMVTEIEIKGGNIDAA